MRISDWSSDVCSSDLPGRRRAGDHRPAGGDEVSARLLVAAMLTLFMAPVAAQDRLPPAPYAYQQLADPAKEAKAKALMETLRCLVCQGQSIADSDAPLAGDMRHEVRSRSEERPVGKECVRTCRSRWSQSP